jgi:hypothetical protein
VVGFGENGQELCAGGDGAPFLKKARRASSTCVDARVFF